MEQRVRHQKNVAGPFYVENGCCTGCGVPQAEAADLITYDEEIHHCYFRKQPNSPDEIYRTFRAMLGAEFDCLRYGGNDENIIRRLYEMGSQSSWDGIADFPAQFLLRTHVSFEADWAKNEIEIALELSSYIANKKENYRVTDLRSANGLTTFSFAWYEDNFHPIQISKGEPNSSRWLIKQLNEEISGIGVAFLVEDWLKNQQKGFSIRWYSSNEWGNSKPKWQETPL